MLGYQWHSIEIHKAINLLIENNLFIYKKHLWISACSIIFMLSQTSCASQNVPPKMSIKEFLQEEFANTHADIKSMEILASDNFGDRVEPIIKSRIKTVWSFNEDLYYETKEELALLQVRVFDKYKTKGTEVQMYSIVTSVPVGGKWKHTKKSAESIRVIKSQMPKEAVERIFKYPGRSSSLLTASQLPANTIVKGEDEYIYAVRRERNAAIKQQEERKHWEDQVKMLTDKKKVIARGEEVYNNSCAECHKANGVGITGSIPALKGSSIVNGPKDQHLAMVLYGKAGTAMKGFYEQLNDVDIAAVVTYERNAWGNNVKAISRLDGVVSPYEVSNERANWARDKIDDGSINELPLNQQVELQLKAYAQKSKYISQRTKEFKYASYMLDWVAKIVRVGKQNHPETARLQNISGKVIVQVGIYPDGSVREINIRKSSGHKALDEVAVSIIKRAAPFSPFPYSIKKEVDILNITRTLVFNTEQYQR